MKKSWTRVLKHTWNDFGADRCTDLAAALSYYTMFAIPPLIMLALLALGMFVDPATIQSWVQGQAGSMIGPQGAEAIQTIMKSAHGPNLQRPLTAVIGIAALLLSAVGFFLSLQSALNRAWDVAPDPKLSIVKNFLVQRLAGFIMLVVIAAVLLASVVASALISAFGGYAAGFLPSAIAGMLLQAINFLVSLAVITVLFALIFKLLPDVAVHWGDVWIGAFVTALLFTIGKLLIGLYLGHSNPGSAFGAAGSVILLLVWIYYSSVILLLGAEFTQAHAVERGQGVKPKKHAVRIVEARAPNDIANQPDGAGAKAHAVGDEGEGPRSEASKDPDKRKDDERGEGRAAD